MLELLTIRKVIAGLILIYGVLAISRVYNVYNNIENKLFDKGYKKDIKNLKQEIKDLKEELKKAKKEEANA